MSRSARGLPTWSSPSLSFFRRAGGGGSEPSAAPVEATSPAPATPGTTPPPVPEVRAGNRRELEGNTLEIRGLDDALPHRSCVWIPTLQAIAGGTNVFAGLHAWTADTHSTESRAQWIRKLETMATLKPKVVVRDHALPREKQDASQITYARASASRSTSARRWRRAR